MGVNMKTTLAAAAALVATVLAQHAQAGVVGKLPTCPDGMHTRFCWKDCAENVCGYTPDEDENCAEVPMVCADGPAPKSSWTDAETRAFQLNFCRCDDLDAYFDMETLTCVATKDECSSDASESNVTAVSRPELASDDEDVEEEDTLVQIGIVEEDEIEEDDQEDEEEDATPTCPDTMEYKECGTRCVKTCGEKAPGKFCTMDCVPGCYCKKASRWYDPVTDRCVKKNKCTPRDQ
ncbi:Mucin-5B [Hondaea fermentalgiana]|uniref:Mucin-5B n=1 Tax=Hondaea fermentalgiana TaxID=2315210 RepID=A0A2R5GSC4_9STRA|nr:Mucin-5B [Hondaea fermentalgiana]|eukprot:GBG32658.1 Mucin-5B [Hondaea fermentalgiana]